MKKTITTSTRAQAGRVTLGTVPRSGLPSWGGERDFEVEILADEIKVTHSSGAAVSIEVGKTGAITMWTHNLSGSAEGKTINP